MISTNVALAGLRVNQKVLAATTPGFVRSVLHAGHRSYHLNVPISDLKLSDHIGQISNIDKEQLGSKLQLGFVSWKLLDCAIPTATITCHSHMAAVTRPQSQGHSHMATVTWLQSHGRSHMAAVTWPQSHGHSGHHHMAALSHVGTVTWP
eukprot:g10368.t1